MQHSQPRDRQLGLMDLMTLLPRSGRSLYSLTQCWSGDTTPKHPAPAFWLKTGLQDICDPDGTKAAIITILIHDRCKAKALKC